MDRFRGQDIISVESFTKDDLLQILGQTKGMKEELSPNLLREKILGSCFFEPSTRTRLSFESAMLRLGGSVIGFGEVQGTSVSKGESLGDTMRMVANYADVITIRHPLEGSAQLAADVVEIPVINAGDGANQHPTQTFLDLFTIQECQGHLEGLSIGMMGDLKYGRTAHSLAKALIPFRARLYFLSCPSLEMPKPICDQLRENGIKFSFHRHLDEILPKLDILYVTRLQKERFEVGMEYADCKKEMTVKMEHLEKVKNNLRIMHPLPRVGEIDPEIDKSPHAYYFEQAKNGLYVRQALLSLVLGEA